MPCMSVLLDPANSPILGVVIAPSGVLKSLRSSEADHADANGSLVQPVASLTTFPLLIDTGADTTCISPQVVQQLNLMAIGLVPVSVPTGQGVLSKYLVDIGIPFVSTTPPGSAPVSAQVVVVPNIEVIEYQGVSQHYQGLLGRNMLASGHFSLSIWNRSFTICI